MKIILKDETAHIHMVDCKNLVLTSEFTNEIVIDCLTTKSHKFGKIILNTIEAKFLLKVLPQLLATTTTKPDEKKDLYWLPIQQPFPATKPVNNTKCHTY